MANKYLVEGVVVASSAYFRTVGACPEEDVTDEEACAFSGMTFRMEMDFMAYMSTIMPYGKGLRDFGREFRGEVIPEEEKSRNLREMAEEERKWEETREAREEDLKKTLEEYDGDKRRLLDDLLSS